MKWPVVWTTLSLLTVTTAYVEYDPNAKCVSGSAQLLNNRNCKVECGTDRPGGDYKRLATATLQDCILACAADTTCVTAQYRISRKYCYLKRTTGKPKVDEQVDGVVCGPPKTSTTTSATKTVSTTPATPTTPFSDDRCYEPSNGCTYPGLVQCANSPGHLSNCICARNIRGETFCGDWFYYNCQPGVGRVCRSDSDCGENSVCAVGMCGCEARDTGICSDIAPCIDPHYTRDSKKRSLTNDKVGDAIEK